MADFHRRLQRLEESLASDPAAVYARWWRPIMERLLTDPDAFGAAAALADRLNELGVSGERALVAIENDPTTAALAAKLPPASPARTEHVDRQM